MTVDEVTAALLRLCESGHRFRFIDQAHRVLTQVDAAPQLSMQAFRVLVELGLGGPARELLDARTDLGDAATREHLRTAIEALADGDVSWNDCRWTFDRNLEAIRSCRPSLLSLAESAPEMLREVQLHRSIQGQLLISRRGPGKLRSWLADLTTLEDKADLGLPPKGKLGPVAVVGARTGPVLEAVYEHTHHLYLTYSHPLYLIEPDPIRFAAWLHCGDQRRWIEDERVHMVVGPDAFDELSQLLHEKPRLAIPAMVVNFSGDPNVDQRLQDIMESVQSRRQDRLDQLKQQLEDRYGDRDAAYWSEHLKAPGTVLGITSRFTTMLQYSTRDALKGLANQGFETATLLENNDYEMIPPAEVCQAILDHDPVLILILDHHRYEHPHIHKNIPFLCWIQDPMPNLFCNQAGESIGELDFVCGYFPGRCVDEFGYPAERFEFTNVPVSNTVFHDGPMDDSSKSKYACDLCFVSNASKPIERFYQESLAGYPAGYHPLLESIYEHIQGMLDENEHLDFQTTAVQLVQESAAASGLQLPPEQIEHVKSHFAYRLFDWGRRQQTLEWAADWALRTGRSFRLYGRGWEDHPRLAKFAAGVLEHGEPLRCAYRAARLAFQLIPEGFRHQRSSEILAAGSLPLARYCEVDFKRLPIEEFVAQRAEGKHPDGIATIFPRLERVIFRTADEFEALAEQYLKDQTLRDEVLGELREVVMRDYTYDSVMKRVLESFQKQIQRSAEAKREACSV